MRDRGTLQPVGPSVTVHLSSRSGQGHAGQGGARNLRNGPHQQILASQKRVLDPDHPDTLMPRNNVAAVYQDAGRTDDAITLLQQALADRNGS